MGKFVVTPSNTRIELTDAHIHMNGLLDVCSLGKGDEIRISTPNDVAVDILAYSQHYYIANELPSAAEARQRDRYASLSDCFDEFETSIVGRYDTAEKLQAFFAGSNYLQNTMCIRFVVRAMLQLKVKSHAKT